MQKLQVPENIPLRWEAWRGFGAPELIKSLVLSGITLAGAMVFCTVSTMEADKLIAVMAVAFVFAFCMGLFSKLENNQSIYDFFKRQLAYQREQQVFLYHREKEAYCLAETESKP